MNALIVKFDSDTQREIFEIINGILEYIADPFGCTPDDLYVHWLLTQISLVYNKTYIPTTTTVPTLEMENTIESCLSSYVDALRQMVTVPVVFPDNFTVQRIDSNSLLIKGV
jgi:hypothetical protein